MIQTKDGQDGVNGLWTDKEMSVEAIVDQEPHFCEKTWEFGDGLIISHVKTSCAFTIKYCINILYMLNV